MSTPLAAFCNLLIQFFEDLSETYPEEKDLKMAIDGLQLAKKAHPRKIHDYFMLYVHKEFKTAILTQNEAFILSRTKEVLNSEFSEFGYAFWIFDKHWGSMSEPNKQSIWKYLKALIVLAERAA